MAEYANPDALVSTEWLAQHLQAPDVRVVDATTFLPTDPRNGGAEYEKAHIPGAVYFNIDDIADTGSSLPHMLPAPEKFSSKVRKLGLGDGSRIVVYDANGGFLAACRVWWMFRVFGHEDVALLDGGLPKWVAEERPVDDLPPTPRERHFTARTNNTLLRSFNQIMANLDSKRDQVIDARSPGRFNGQEPEPRPSKKTGHIPGSINLPIGRVMNPNQCFAMRPADAIADAIAEAGIDPAKPVAATCGSGVTAAVLAFGFYLLGYEDVAVYDGSWAEWGDHDDAPVEP